MSVDPLVQEGLVRTDMHCHGCSNGFVAQLDYDIDGNHIVECPHCGHEHCRKIEKGKITDDRWDGHNNKVAVPARRVLKHTSLKMQTTTASEFIRDRWLNKEA